MYLETRESVPERTLECHATCWRQSVAILTVCILSIMAPAELGGEAPRCQWVPGFDDGGAGLDDRVSALTVHDDGSGPALYAGGHFETAGGVITNNIARWDGRNWSTVGDPIWSTVGQPTGIGSGPFHWVRALTVYGDGDAPALYAGGNFDVAGGVTVNNIAKWDGSEWSALSGPLGTGTDDRVYALTVYDDGSGPALFAGGWFDKAGGVPVKGIAKWNGHSWSALSGPLGTGTSGSRVYALAVYDDGSGPALYVGGSFVIAGGVVAESIARWDGSTWSALPGGGIDFSNDTVWALTVYDDGSGPYLYVGGSFDHAGGAQMNNVVRWNGNWFPVGGGTSSTVSALAVHDDGSGSALYVGGSFHSAGDVGGPVVTNNVAKWDGSTWSPLSGPFGTGTSTSVFGLMAFQGDLYAGGRFVTAGGLDSLRIGRYSCALFMDGFESGDVSRWSRPTP